MDRCVPSTTGCYFTSASAQGPGDKGAGLRMRAERVLTASRWRQASSAPDSIPEAGRVGSYGVPWRLPSIARAPRAGQGGQQCRAPIHPSSTATWSPLRSSFAAGTSARSFFRPVWDLMIATVAGSRRICQIRTVFFDLNQTTATGVEIQSLLQIVRCFRCGDSPCMSGRFFWICLPTSRPRRPSGA